MIFMDQIPVSLYVSALGIPVYICDLSSSAYIVDYFSKLSSEIISPFNSGKESLALKKLLLCKFIAFSSILSALDTYDP